MNYTLTTLHQRRRVDTCELKSQIKDQKSKIGGAISILLVLFLLIPAPPNGYAATARIKDIARIAGLERIELMGYGVIIGLNGSGDKDIELTKQTMANLLEHFQITLPVEDVESKNVAAVVVTALAPPFHKAGDCLDITVSSVGDATSLEGGILLMTPLVDPNGEVYALAQGSITVGGFSAGKPGAGGMTVTRNYTTVGIIPKGARLKKGQSADFCQDGVVHIILRHADFTTADRMAAVINRQFGGLAVARDAGTVVVRIPQEKVDTGQAAAFVAELEQLSLTPDIAAKVIVNERTGTIVMGGAVHISEAVVAHANLTVTIKSEVRVDQPKDLILVKPQPGIKTVKKEDVKTTLEADEARIMIMPERTTVRELADTLYLMGATPRDLISILEALHRLGAIHMDLVAM